jgi:hypothetical protein
MTDDPFAIVALRKPSDGKILRGPLGMRAQPAIKCFREIIKATKISIKTGSHI